MSLTMYQASVPVLIRMLGNLNNILAKAKDHAETEGYDPNILTQSRLYPDMFPLSRQVHIATDAAKGCAARLAGQEPPAYEDTETTFDELIARVEKTIAFIKGFEADQINGSEDLTITLKLGKHTPTFPGRVYLQHFVLPNMYFHITTTYAILRHNGVKLGKLDYLGDA